MRLLELLPKLEAYGRIKRDSWQDRYLVRHAGANHHPLISCDFNCLQMEAYMFSYDDLTTNDWSVIE